MAIQNVMKFIRESQENKELRREINQCPAEKIFPRLEELGYEFTMDEFEESINLMHVKCQTEEEYNRLMQTQMWFKMLI